MFFRYIREWAIALVQHLAGIDARAVKVKDLISIVESAAELRDAAKRLQDAHPASAAILIDAATKLEQQRVDVTSPLLLDGQPAEVPAGAPALAAPNAGQPQQIGRRGPGRPRKTDAGNGTHNNGQP